jgi:tetratricopeptide (TPR) repeat protein
VDHGWYDLAIADYDRLIELDPNYSEYYHGRAAALAEEGQWDQAIEDTNRYLDHAPDSAERLNLGLMHRVEGDYDLALGDFTRLVETAPSFAQAYVERGATELLRGQLQRADDDFAKALEHSADNGSPDAVDARLLRRLVRSRQGRADARADSEDAASFPADRWPGVLFASIGGLGPPLRSVALQGVDDPSERRWRLCDIALWPALAHVALGDQAGAAPLLHDAVRTCPALSYETAIAQAELRRTGA